jgi:secondary thiamine-phosphate synthase enzyme
MLKKLTVESTQDVEFVEITDQIKDLVAESGVDSGILQIFIPHDSAAVTMMGTSNTDIAGDIKFEINKLDDDFGHIESNTSAAHFKSSVFGVDISFIIDGGELLLGPTQGIYLTDFMGPAEREVLVKILEG